MKRILVALIVASLFLGMVHAEYRERYEALYTIDEKGNANVTFTTIWYAPEDLINQSKEAIMNMTVENASKAILYQEEQKLRSAGLYLINGTVELEGYNTTGPLKKTLRGYFAELAKYYAYDDTWELEIDILRLLDLSQAFQSGGIAQNMTLDSYFTIQLPEDASDVSVPKPFENTLGENSVKIESNVSGNSVSIHTYIHLVANTTTQELVSLFGDYKMLPITYKGIKGEDIHELWKAERVLKLHVYPDHEELTTIDRLYSPPEYIMQTKLQLLQLGVENATKLLTQQTRAQLQAQGVTVESGNVTLGDMKGDTPIEIMGNWVVKNYTKKNGDLYEYTYIPNFQINPDSLGRRFPYELNQTSRVEITLEDGEFVEVPENFTKDYKGNRIELRVTREGNTLVMENSIYLRYGATKDDILELVKEVPEEVYVKYRLNEPSSTESSSKTGTCGPGFIGAFALLPLLLRRRR
ncbi:CGP-CTERM sorting domain-containing protein [Palaeococcus ferrophilus]|uniref:CGP-CTERM sorting domain-containing protein n=1 Tax=Palaeococcus ferrophilus TaxID=83868 RepID=UPI00064EB23B|nr:CGP-CTERM sorting domain-containing protein [Palaeococcus ferrophilus]